MNPAVSEMGESSSRIDLGRSYAGLKTTVTGGCSFIGSHLVERLVALGAQVSIVDDLSSGRLENVRAVADRIDFIEGDLRNFDVACRATAGRTAIFHLANIHGGRGFIETHRADVSQNMVIDGNVYRAAVIGGVQRVCFASSACVYPTNLQVPEGTGFVRFLEEPMADPFERGCALADGEYGWGKLMGEMALKAFHAQYGLKGVSCRLFTAYGPRENESHAIIAFIAKAAMRQSPFEIWGSGRQDRNFTFVDDTVEGMLRAALAVDDASAVNIGTDEVTSVLDAAKIICDIVGHSPGAFVFDESKPEGPRARAASVALQRRLLGWHPSVSFDDGIRRTVEWYLANRSGALLEPALGRSMWFER